MWIPISIDFKNLFSHEDTTFHFKRNEMQLLLGENKDEEGANSNGAGKSTIIEAISLAVTGSVYRDINKDQFIRIGQQSCALSFSLQNLITKDTFVIYREIFAGTKGSILNLSMNGKPIKEFDSKSKLKRSAQEYIYDTIGIKQDDFLNHFCIGQGNENSFFASTDTKQKEVISRFSNYNKIDKIIDKIKQDIKQNEEDSNQVKIESQIYLGQIEDIKDNIESLSNNEKHEEEKQSLQEALDELLERISQGNQKISDLEKDLTKEKIKLATLKKESKIKDDIITLKKKLRETKDFRDSQEEALDILKELKGQLAIRNGKIIICPKCKWQFIPNDDMSVKQIKESKEFVENELMSNNKVLEKHNESIEQFKDQIWKAEEIAQLDNTIANKHIRLIQLRDNEKEIIELSLFKKKEIANLKKGSNIELIKQYENKLKNIKEKNEQCEIKEKELLQKQESLQFHLFSFSKQFRTFIANKTIKTIQDLTNFYLQKFKISMRVLVSGYSILKSGEIRDKLQIWVIKEGNQKVLFKSLSGGEKSRIALCGIISLQKLINNSCENNGGFDLLAIDEFLQGLDRKGVEEVIKILEESKLTSLLVMHHAEDIYTKNKIIVVKENGVSKIIKNGKKKIA